MRSYVAFDCPPAQDCRLYILSDQTGKHEVLCADLWRTKGAKCFLQVRGKAGSNVDTVAGYQQLVDKLGTLAVDIQELRSAAKDMSTESDILLHSMQVFPVKLCSVECCEQSHCEV